MPVQDGLTHNFWTSTKALLLTIILYNWSAMTTIDYAALAQTAISQYKTYAPAHPEARATATASEPSSSAGLPPLDFDIRTPRDEDQYLLGNFVDDTWISKLESEVEGEQGLYNVALDPAMRTPYALLLPTKDYHEQSAPLRPAYLTHAHRLLVALEDELSATGEGVRVIAVYDCGEKSGVRVGHKCIRYYTVNSIETPPLPYTKHTLTLPSQSANGTDGRVELFASLLNGTTDSPEPFIPKQPHYNLIMSRDEMIIIGRVDDGFLGKEEGRWDGARLVGVEL